MYIFVFIYLFSVVVFPRVVDFCLPHIIVLTELLSLGVKDLVKRLFGFDSPQYLRYHCRDVHICWIHVSLLHRHLSVEHVKVLVCVGEELFVLRCSY